MVGSRWIPGSLNPNCLADRYKLIVPVFHLPPGTRAAKPCLSLRAFRSVACKINRTHSRGPHTRTRSRFQKIASKHENEYYFHRSESRDNDNHSQINAESAGQLVREKSRASIERALRSRESLQQRLLRFLAKGGPVPVPAQAVDLLWRGYRLYGRKHGPLRYRPRRRGHSGCSTATKDQHEAALNAMRLIADVATVDEVLAGFG